MRKVKREHHPRKTLISRETAFCSAFLFLVNDAHFP